MKVLVADNDANARNAIYAVLEKQPEVDEVCVAQDGKQALAIIEQLHPECLFIELQLPDLHPHVLVEKLGPNQVIVFQSVHDSFVSNLFELTGCEYLLKPFENKHLYKVLDKVRQVLQCRAQLNYSPLASCIELIRKERFNEYKSKMVVNQANSINLLNVDDVVYIRKAEQNAEVRLKGGELAGHSGAFSLLERQLDPASFGRINHATLVNKGFIKKISTSVRGSAKVILQSGETFPLSNRNKTKFTEWFV